MPIRRRRTKRRAPRTYRNAPGQTKLRRKPLTGWKVSLHRCNAMYTVRQVINYSEYGVTYSQANSAGATFIFGGSTNLISLTTPAAAGSSYYSFGIANQITDLPNVNNYWKYLFDRYRIRSVTLRFIPVNTSSLSWLGGNANVGCFLHTIKDYDDATQVAASEGGLQNMMQRPSYKVKNLFSSPPASGWKFTYSPRPSDAFFSGAAFTGYGNASPKQWIDMQSSTVPYYAFKGLFEVTNGTGAVATVQLKLEASYVVQFKDLL